jgi:hypothetical protein
MRKGTWVLVSVVLVAGLVLAGTIRAMSSDNYRLEWFTPLTGSGGGPADSAHYAANLTVGQSVIGQAASDHYRVCLGYWCGVSSYRVYVPLVTRG